MYASVIQTISVVVAALSVVIGVGAWRRSLFGQRRLDLAEQVLELFLEARDALRQIRSPFSYSGEGSTRQRSENETAETSRILDSAYVLIERYDKKAELFSKLFSLRHRFRFYFGPEAAAPFQQLNELVGDLRHSSRVLSRSWQDQGRKAFTEEEFQAHLKRMHEAEAVFWDGFSDPDPINVRIDLIVQSIENTCGSIISSRRTLLGDVRQLSLAIRRYVTGR